ncbi:hypothetical protein [Metabacillus sp. SLBN-84]
MHNVSEMKKRIAPAKPQAKPQAADLSVLLKGLQKQMAQTHQLMKAQAEANQKMSDVQIHWMERIHDRLDAVAVESRVTNMLLSELVAIHQTVITDDTDGTREAVRHEAYHRIRNAE